MQNAIHTSDRRRFDRLWLSLGGTIENLRRTGEVVYCHRLFTHPIRANDRRKDVAAKLLSRLNQLMKRPAANDDYYTMPE